MESTVYNALTNTYKVYKEDGTFDTYTPAQYESKFGDVPEVEEDVADVQSALTEPDLSNTVVVTEADLDEMVSYIIPEDISAEDLDGLNANLPEEINPSVVGDTILLEKNHYLLNSN